MPWRCKLCSSWSKISCGLLFAPSRCEIDYNPHGDMVHVGCTEEAALRSPGSALSQCKMVRPTGTAHPVEGKSSKEDVPKGRGNQLPVWPWGNSAGNSSAPSIQMGFNYKGPICHQPSSGSTSSIQSQKPHCDELIIPQPARLRWSSCASLEARALLSGNFWVTHWIQLQLHGMQCAPY